jgi:hypothetical protein
MPLSRTLAAAAPLHAEPNEQSPAIVQLQPGDPFEMLDDSLGWAWGYAGSDRRVGYVQSDALGAAA